jgi:hypothetical protein
MKKIVISILLISMISAVFAQEVNNNSQPVTNNNNSNVVKANKDEWQTFFMPGAVFHVYVPEMKDSLGYFKGVSVEYLIAAWIHKNENRGPSHGRIYTKVNFMKSSKKDIKDIFYWAIGLDLSLERNPTRNYLIPYFGLEVGDMYQSQLGNIVTITPTLGVHLFTSQNLFVNLTGGYVYPSKHLEELRGYTAQLGVNFSLW